MQRACRRILFVIPTLGGGGAEQILIRWLDHWKAHPLRKGMEPVVVFSIGKAGPYVEDLDPAIPTYELGQNPESALPADILAAAWSLSRIYHRLKPDLVVSLIAHANIMALLAARLFRPSTPVVICEHTHLSTNIRDFFPWAHPLLRALIRRLYPSARRVVAVSQGVKSDLVESFGLDPARVSVVYNPVDTEEVRRHARPDLAPGRAPTILGLGRMFKQKGFRHLIAALALVRREVDARLTLVGDGPLRAELEAQAARMGLGGVVRFTGYQKNPLPFLAEASVFALPSIYEGFGIVLLEAMAAGVPVVATRCPSGPDEIIEDGSSGLLVPVRDERAMADAILRVLREPDLRQRLSEGGMRRAEDFSMSAHMAGYERVFSEVMAP
ncbi:MAG: glycosyltransferase [Elusimicrobia bacterium]|nr:glycosyltransferase [Elusimicrobiota bacterium]